MNSKFSGTGVALVTPFKSDESVDYNGLKKLINHVIDGGVNYVVSLGTTGETATLSKDEKNNVLQFTVKTVLGRVPMVAGFGGNNTHAVIDDILSFNLDGVDAILSVSPYYNKPRQSGIIAHYGAISKKSPLPIILYNVPGRTSSNMSAETIIHLAKNYNNIIGVKEASGNLSQCMQIVKNKPKGFLVISGEDALTLPMISFGIDGVISVVANAFPAEFSQMVKLARNEDFKDATKLHYLLLDFIDLIFAEGNPAGVKFALQDLNICDDHLRLPLDSVSSKLKEQIKRAIQYIK
jgi:4-hydroxy-tetrahydrodipicolinate synthase